MSPEFVISICCAVMVTYIVGFPISREISKEVGEPLCGFACWVLSPIAIPLLALVYIVYFLYMMIVTLWGEDRV